MNFSEEVKNEILESDFSDDGEKKAFLSAVLRTAGSLSFVGGKVGFEVVADNPKTVETFAKLFSETYSLPLVVEKNKTKKRANVCRYVDDATEILDDLGVIAIDGEGVKLKFGLKWDLLETEEEMAAFVKGAFVGSGSVTLPKADSGSSTGYHLEVSFTNYVSATDFSELLSELYVMPKHIQRKDNHVVYLKTCDEIAKLLFIAGAENCAAKVEEVSVEKDVNNNYNRQLNCEMSNMSKQIDASVKQICAIKRLEDVFGADNLPPQLAEVAKARVTYKNDTLSQLAQRLGISKSCLNHRLRKIVELSENV